MAPDVSNEDGSQDATLVATSKSFGPTPGETFAGRYRVDRLLGRGAMGAVFAAHDDEVDEDVAIKILEAAHEDDTLARFRREVRLARRVTHRNAARTYDLGEHEGLRYLTMELVAGESLQDRLARDGRLTPEVAVDMAVQICRGLAAAHGVGVVHRDLKPANVLLEASGRAVITDFGVARGLVDDPQVTVDHLAIIGTPAYMAPEQVRGTDIDARADLFALGVMLFEMLTGRRPYRGQTAMALAAARLSDDPMDLREEASVPSALADVVMRCLERDPAKRHDSAQELAKALSDAAGRGPAPGEVATMAAVDLPRTESSVIPTSPGDKAVAVLPLRYRGPADDAYLAEALCEELVDLLSMTRGLKVAGIGATERLDGERDAKKVGEALGVDAVVDGTLQRAGKQIRISTRLVSATDGVQLWSERFDGQLEDVFELQDNVAKRVAESLRVELSLRADSERIAADAVELYLRARSAAREPDLSGSSLDAALELLDQALVKAPAFAQGLAARAEWRVRRWFLPTADDPRDWPRLSKEAVESALEHASHLAETHVAAARFHVSSGETAEAAKSLRTALEIAPTHAAAHDYLGFLQCEAGRAEEGVRHLLLAHELDPALGTNLLTVARHYAMRGQTDEYERVLRQLRSTPSVPRFAADILEVRVATWSGDMVRVSTPKMTLGFDAAHPAQAMPELMRSVTLGQRQPDELPTRLDEILAAVPSARFRTISRQLATETLAAVGAHRLALQQLQKTAAEGVLLDTDWLEHCPALAPLRGEPEFTAIHQRVLTSADAIWRSM